VRLPGSTREPLRAFSVPGKLLLAVEITVTYVQAHRWLRRAQITETVALARLSPRLKDTTTTAGAWNADPSPQAAQLGIRLGKVIQRIFRLLPGDTRCLTRSIVLMRMLARRHVETRLVIGVRAAPSFGAHAWIEHTGRPLLDPIEPDGQRLIEL
jgi:hypothetical protein